MLALPRYDGAMAITRVRGAGRFSSGEIHRVIFESQKPEARSLADMKEGIRSHARKRYVAFDKAVARIDGARKI